MVSSLNDLSPPAVGSEFSSELVQQQANGIQPEGSKHRRKASVGYPGSVELNNRSRAGPSGRHAK
jgi:hypothetical protein